MNARMSIYHSVLAEQMQQFVAFKRMQGCDYTDQARKLSYFDRFLVAELGAGEPYLRLDTLQSYVDSTTHLETFSRYTRLTAVREFSRYLHARRSESAILPKDILPRREPTVRFYRIEPEQVAALMAANQQLCGYRQSTRHNPELGIMPFMPSSA